MYQDGKPQEEHMTYCAERYVGPERCNAIQDGNGTDPGANARNPGSYPPVPWAARIWPAFGERLQLGQLRSVEIQARDPA
jgi:hypothetical protein